MVVGKLIVRMIVDLCHISLSEPIRLELEINI